MNEKIIINDEFHNWKVNKVKYLELKNKYNNFSDYFYVVDFDELEDDEFEKMVSDCCEEDSDC